MPIPYEAQVIRLAPCRLPFDEALRRLCARHGLQFAFWKKYRFKNEMTMMFTIQKDSYWSVVGEIPASWKTPEEHDDLFYDALEASLGRWLAAHRTSDSNR